MKTQITLGASAVLAALMATPASAVTTLVTTVAPPPSATNWGTISSENRGGTIAVTGTVARSGNGSIEMTGDRTRAQIGIQYAPFTTNLGVLSDVSALTFDWRIAGDSVSALSPFLTPALRLLIQDGATRKELIWEGAYNNTYGNTVRDAWYTTTSNDKFYITGGNVNNGQTIAQWAAQLTGATVSGLSVGNGSSAGAGYHAFADNVALTKGGVTTTYNFETLAGAVPEPATWLTMILGFGFVGTSLRRRAKVRTAVAFA